jgi:spermidine/putrescine transport system substrate-binding protein
MKILYKNFLIVILFLTPSAFAFDSNNILNVYIWGNYMPEEVINQFTKETGIQVNLTEYDNNETMFAKIKTLKKSGYDIVVPSNQYVDRMIKHDMLHPLDKGKLPNFRNIRTWLLDKKFDPKNRFSVPYLWGTTGIVINTQYINPKEVTSWKNFWNPKYKNKLMMLNDLRDVFSVSLLMLGYSVNETDPAKIEKAYFKLKELLPNIKLFNVDTVPNIYIDEDATIGMIWSGDCKLAQKENKHLKYIYPKEGFPLWIDSFVILKTALHVDNAHKFLNFMLQPEIAKLVSEVTRHSTVNQVALKLMTEKEKNNPIDNPGQKLMQHAQIQLDFDEQIRLIYEKYWEKLKVGD